LQRGTHNLSGRQDAYQAFNGTGQYPHLGRQSMKDFSKYKEIGDTTNTVVYIVESDPDILIIVPREGTMDNAEDARENVAFYYSYARALGKPCGSLVVMTNMLAQDAEARRAYQQIDPNLIFAAALVVENALSRALGSFFMGLSRPNVATKLFDSVDSAIEWLKTMRPEQGKGDSHAR
jgi:hypothetical protein